MAKVTDIDSPMRAKRKRTPVSAQSAAKAKQAYELMLGGKPRSEVAELLGFKHAGDVSRLVSEKFRANARYLTEMERKEMLGIALLRLEALLDAVWLDAMTGDPKAVDTARNLIATQAKISGLEQVDPVVNKNLVLVMGEKEEDYIAQLRSISDE